MVRWGKYGIDKKCTRTRYAELVFLYLVGFAGHVVHSGASGRETLTQYFSCSGVFGAVFIKMHRDTLRQTCIFASGQIHGSNSALWCSFYKKCVTTCYAEHVFLHLGSPSAFRCPCVKLQRTTSHAWLGPVRI
jgi:hypothetical protein